MGADQVDLQFGGLVLRNIAVRESSETGGEAVHDGLLFEFFVHEGAGFVDRAAGRFRELNGFMFPRDLDHVGDGQMSAVKDDHH